MALSPDGRVIATGDDYDRRVLLHERETGRFACKPSSPATKGCKEPRNWLFSERRLAGHLVRGV